MTRHEATKAVLRWDLSGGIRREGCKVIVDLAGGVWHVRVG
jgi:hypothetical protein